MGKRLLSVPYEVTVATKQGGLYLRAAKLFNFTTVRVTLREARDRADRFGCLTPEEMRCREMLKKYWLEPASALTEEDKSVLTHLVEHFEKRPVLGRSPGEYLKRINMLFSLAMMLETEPAAVRHFSEYLSALTTYDLEDMLLLGGAHMIDTAIRWQHFGAADKMLSRWLASSETASSVDSVRKFAGTISFNGHLWQAANLLDRVLPSLDAVQDQCSLSVSRTLALWRLCKHSIAGGKSTREKAQVSWALSQVKPDALVRMFDESITQAEELLVQYEGPARSEMNKWLDRCRKDRSRMAASWNNK
jgi:hypothetical protein